MENNMSMGLDMTITDYITQYNNEDITFSEFFLKQVFTTDAGKKLLINFENIMIKYMPELKDLKVKVTLSNEEYSKYKYNPKLLSYDIYGTTELWFLILEANELHTISQFNSKTLYLFQTDILNKAARILNLEVDNKNYNEDEISAIL